ncbi:MAG TPA: histidine kinase [Galbitalea sp.]|jgi:signal transduction histidine kinase|nr:histidine kinase [Galbitalea sp.]
MFRKLKAYQQVVDVVIGLVYFLVAFSFREGPTVVGLLALGFAVALGFRRSSPALSLIVAWATALLQMFVLGLPPGLADFAILAVIYATAYYGSPLLRRIGLASVFVGGVAGAIYVESLSGGSLVGLRLDLSSVTMVLRDLLVVVFYLALLVLLLASPWIAGTLLRTRVLARERLAAQRTAQLDAEAAEQDVIVEQERNRIARDMHDVVAHSLAVVIAQADGARYARENDPNAVDGALSAISSTARDALADVRLLLGQLRHPQTEGPQPALADLSRLLDQLRSSGLTIAFTVKGTPLQLGTGQQLAVYRIVQEALTNALRHGDIKQEVVVRFEWGRDELGMTITSVVQASPATAELRLGHGLTGMKERAALVGGSLATRVNDKNFVVVAHIPATATASATPMTAVVTKQAAPPASAPEPGVAQW